MVSMLSKVWKHKMLFIMRLTFSICLFCVLQSFSIGTFSQNVRLSINQKNISVESVIQLIEDRTDYYFMYSALVVDVKRTVDVEATNKLVSEILDDILKGTDTSYRIDGRLVALSRNGELSQVVQQQKTVTGKVTDSSGASLPGVSVVIKGTTIGTITDANGNYSISNIPPDGILQFSFVGMKTQEVKTGNQTTINITLADETIGVDEVVVVGYGTQSARNVTGSISKVNMLRNDELPNTNITQALRGSVAGVQVIDDGRPGQNGTILIRGPRSLSASNSPLIVLDGVMFSGSLSNINPSDIKSIEVLKDASAAAIYGSRAANGVILVTSKGGTTEEPSINFNSNNGVLQWGHKVKLFSPERYLQSKLDWSEQSGQTVDWSQPEKYLYASEAENYSKGIIHDPWEEASQPGRINSYDLSISRRTKKSNYYISGSYSNEEGLIFNDSQKRISVRVNIDTHISNWLSVGMSSHFVQRDLSGKEANVGAAYYSSPYGTWYHEDGEPTKYVVEEDQVSGNPVYASILTDNKEIYHNLFCNLYTELSVPFIKGLNYRLNYSPHYRWNREFNFFRQDKYLTNNTTSASKYYRNDFDWLLENIVTYEKEFKKDHYLKITLLYGRDHSGYETTTTSADNFSIGVLGYNKLALGNNTTGISSAAADDGVSSMFRINYSFKRKYLLTLTTRRDGSSVFAENNKYATFPSGSIAWIISDEAFLKQVQFVDMLKLRLSYGAVGNQAISPYQSLSSSRINQYVYGDGGSTSIGVYPKVIGNSNLKWETTKVANAAIDFSLFKGKLGGTLEIYNTNTHDLLVTRSIPEMTGYSSIFTNLGQVNNKGIELSLNSINIKTEKFEWSSSLAFSSNRNKIIHLYNSDADNDGKEDDDISNGWFIGHPITSFYDYVFDGIYQEGDTDMPSGYKPGYVRLKDLNGDGKITKDDRKIVGSGGQPDFRIGLTNNFTYGNLSLSVFVNSMLGWTSSFPLLNTTKSPNAPGRGLNQLDAGYWTAENKSTTRPSLVYNNPQNHDWYVSRNFLRIQDVSLSYDFTKVARQKLKISNLKIFLSGKNIYTFTKWPGADPESGKTGYTALYPMPRIISMGINIGI